MYLWLIFLMILLVQSNQVEIIPSSSTSEDVSDAVDAAGDNRTLASDATASTEREINFSDNADLSKCAPSNNGGNNVSCEVERDSVAVLPACSTMGQAWGEEKSNSIQGNTRLGKDNGDSNGHIEFEAEDRVLAASPGAGIPTSPHSVRKPSQNRLPPWEKRQLSESKDAFQRESSSTTTTTEIVTSPSKRDSSSIHKFTTKMSSPNCRSLFRSKSQEVYSAKPAPVHRSNSLPHKMPPFGDASTGSSSIAKSLPSSSTSRGRGKIRPPPPGQRPKALPRYARRYTDSQSIGTKRKNSSSFGSNPAKPLRKTRTNSQPSAHRPSTEPKGRNASPPRSRLRGHSYSQDRSIPAPAVVKQRTKSLPRRLPSDNVRISTVTTQSSSSSTSTVGRGRAQSRIERSTFKGSRLEAGARQTVLEIPVAPPVRRLKTSAGMRPPAPSRRPIKSPVARYNDGKSHSGSGNSTNSDNSEKSASVNETGATSAPHGVHVPHRKPHRSRRVPRRLPELKNGDGVNNSSTTNVKTSDDTGSIRSEHLSASDAVPKSIQKTSSSSRRNVCIKSESKTRIPSASEQQRFNSVRRSVPPFSGSSLTSSTTAPSLWVSSIDGRSRRQHGRSHVVGLNSSSGSGSANSDSSSSGSNGSSSGGSNYYSSRNSSSSSSSSSNINSNSNSARSSRSSRNANGCGLSKNFTSEISKNGSNFSSSKKTADKTT